MTSLAKIFLATLALAACSTAEQKPTQWKVKATTEGEKKIWVTKADGSQQCAPKAKVLTPQKAAEQLKGAGIPVFDSRLGNDGLMRTQRCGTPTGRTVDLEISRRDISKVLAMGFVTKSTGEP